jgi:hypothetical protein
MPQMGYDTKTDWLTDCQSQYDFDFDFENETRPDQTIEIYWRQLLM